MKNGIFFLQNHSFLLVLTTLAPNFYVRVRPWAEPNLIFRFRFGAKSAEPGPNRTVASLPQMPFTNFAGHSRATRSTAQELRLYLCQSTCHERETGDLGSENNTWDVQVGGAFRWHIYLFVKLLLCLFLILYFLRADRADLLRQ